MTTQELKEVRDYIIMRLSSLEIDTSSGHLDFPDFQLNAYDYLDFAAPLCEDNSSSSLISCIAHLKRAVDCQLDTFLVSIGLSKLFEKKNLKFEKKLEIIEAAGVFRSDTLKILNNKRNSLEHEYSVPVIENVRTYYELVWAFVEVIESHMMMLLSFGEMHWYARDENNVATDHFYIKLHKGTLRITVDSTTLKKELNVIPTDVLSTKLFLLGLNMIFLLARSESMWPEDRVIPRLAALKFDD